jgi:diguanylate cyclase (GGDEF)-like protein
MNFTLEKKLAEFRKTFIADYNQKLSMLVKLWADARTTHQIDIVKKFRFEVHSIKGTSGTLGFLNLNKTLDLIEIQIAPCEKDINLLKNVTSVIDQHMNFLIKTAEEQPNSLLMLDVSAQSSIQNVVKEANKNTDNDNDNDNDEITSQSYRDITIALINTDQAASNLTHKLLADFGFKVNVFDSISALSKVLLTQSFKLVLIDIENAQNTAKDIFEFCLKLDSQNIDVFMLSPKDSFELRINAIRANVNDFLLKPINITTLVSKIRKNFKLDLSRPYRILLLDDQASIGIFYKTLLENDGVEVLAMSKAEKIMAKLDSFHPDVFLLDMHMPDVSGIEIAKLLRQQAKYDYVPIIFLSADEDVDTKLEVLQCGADDIISKNTAPNVIVKQIFSRIQRGQEIRYIASRDSLTGVLNHGQIMDAAAHALRLSARQEKPIIVVMIDLDNFKSVNDKYGHLGGDKVLISLGQLLLQSVRDTDYVGRYGGEEFMVVFNNTDIKVIEEKINNILTAFQHINYSVDEHTFNCSFSAGLASSACHDKLSELIASADNALYQAKDAGRNRVFVHQVSAIN